MFRLHAVYFSQFHTYDKIFNAADMHFIENVVVVRRHLMKHSQIIWCSNKKKTKKEMNKRKNTHGEWGGKKATHNHRSNID